MLWAISQNGIVSKHRLCISEYCKNGGLEIEPQPGNVILHGILALERESGMERFNYEVCTGRDEPGYYAYVPDFETCFGQGETYEEMIESIGNGLVSFVEGQVAFGLDIPNATFGHRPAWTSPARGEGGRP